jgi:hypothetical protein
MSSNLTTIKKQSCTFFFMNKNRIIGSTRGIKNDWKTKIKVGHMQKL